MPASLIYICSDCGKKSELPEGTSKIIFTCPNCFTIFDINIEYTHGTQVWDVKKLPLLTPFNELDKFALLASQEYNLGNNDNWFFCFRGGIDAIFTRVKSAQIHYSAIHSWEFPKPFLISTQRAEYHLSSILFNMDSTMECLVFALNALGYGANPEQFKDISREKGLKSIMPSNILGIPPNNTEGLVDGYDTYFPSLKEYWNNNRDLINLIFENHDVSKHRSVTFIGGEFRRDPPPGFFETLRIADDSSKQILISPLLETLLEDKPKIPLQKRNPQRDQTHTLEETVERFYGFISICGIKALENAKSNIKLNYNRFKK